ncbi:anthranilate phosphoribosyltransferase [Thermoplasma sp.]|uniref:anthranilate phosphoribosyltransferase n=1 Tax=Thermoplasma sp. TaxID=1973142 RepID=UPI0025F59102|nr:anthranilate phosphoribosyltransferase [Thermoplasma sp.]
MYEGFLTGEPMDRIRAMNLMRYMASDECTDAFRAAVLSVLRVRGVTEEEMIGFYDAMRVVDRATDSSDIVGTGGDMAHTINVSTASAIVAGSLGIKISKFGNRSASGSHGSADFMTEAGYVFPRTIDEAAARLSRSNFVFLYAPDFLKEFALFANVRRRLGFPTVLNFLGPILNPLSPMRRVIGTSDESFMDLYAGIAKRSGITAMIIHSADGMDEISPFSRTRIVSVDGSVNEIFVEARSIVGKIASSSVVSSDPKRIFELTLSAIRGENIDGSKFVAINTAPLLVMNGLASNLEEGYAIAFDQVMNGKAAEFLEMIVHDR